MNQVTQVRMNSWALMVKERCDSGMTVKAWCAENGISTKTYYYRLNRLRNYMLESGAADQAAANDSSGQFVKLPASGNAAGSSDVALRIRRGDTLIEVSNDASDGILTLLKEVMTYAV